MTKAEALSIIKELHPKTYCTSAFISPVPQFSIDATDVFDCIRNHSTPQITEEEFNLFCNTFDKPPLAVEDEKKDKL